MLRTLVAVGASLALAVVLTAVAEGQNLEKGKEIYAKFCASCHGTTGKGDGPAAAALTTKPRDHTDGKYMNALSDQDLFNIIKGGGTSVGKSPLMPPWGAALKEEDIRNVIVYVRSLAK